MEIKKTLVAKVVGESMGVAEAGVDAPEVLVDSDKTLIEGRVIMDYGSSGDGKSTRAHSFARFYFMRTGKPIVLIAAEDSTKAVFQDLIDVGIVVPIFLTSSKTPLSVYERIVEGELPLPGEFDVIEKSAKKDGKDVVEKFTYLRGCQPLPKTSSITSGRPDDSRVNRVMVILKVAVLSWQLARLLLALRSKKV
jgi:hypothetical protein